MYLSNTPTNFRKCQVLYTKLYNYKFGLASLQNSVIPLAIRPNSPSSPSSDGPFNPVLEKFEKKGDDKILEWLDKQGLNSVVFVSFGTTSSLSDEQIFEIAFGLEKSEQKFVWVLRDADKGDVFKGHVRRAPLPEGFESRVKERGLIVRDWAPQLEILGHPSVGFQLCFELLMPEPGYKMDAETEAAVEELYSSEEAASAGIPDDSWPVRENSDFKCVRDCGIFLMNHMEIFRGHPYENPNLKKRDERRLLRAKYCATLLLSDVNHMKSQLEKDVLDFSNSRK